MVTESFVDTLEALKNGNFSFFADETTKVCTFSEIEEQFKEMLDTGNARRIEHENPTTLCIAANHTKLGRIEWYAGRHAQKEHFQLDIDWFTLCLQTGGGVDTLSMDWSDQDQAKVVANRLGLSEVRIETNLT